MAQPTSGNQATSSSSYEIRWQVPLTPQSFTSAPPTMPGPILMLTPPSVPVAAQGSSQQSQSPKSSLQDQVVTAVREPQPRSMYNEIIQLVGINLVSAMTERIAELELRCNELEREKEAKSETVIVTESRLVRSAHCDALETNTKDKTEAKYEANPMDGIPYEAILHQLAIVDVLLDGAIHCYESMPADGA